MTTVLKHPVQNCMDPATQRVAYSAGDRLRSPAADADSAGSAGERHRQSNNGLASGPSLEEAAREGRRSSGADLSTPSCTASPAIIPSSRLRSGTSNKPSARRLPDVFTQSLPTAEIRLPDNSVVCKPLTTAALEQEEYTQACVKVPTKRNTSSTLSDERPGSGAARKSQATRPGGGAGVADTPVPTETYGVTFLSSSADLLSFRSHVRHCATDSRFARSENYIYVGAADNDESQTRSSRAGFHDPRCHDIALITQSERSISGCLKNSKNARQATRSRAVRFTCPSDCCHNYGNTEMTSGGPPLFYGSSSYGDYHLPSIGSSANEGGQRPRQHGMFSNANGGSTVAAAQHEICWQSSRQCIPVIGQDDSNGCDGGEASGQASPGVRLPSIFPGAEASKTPVIASHRHSDPTGGRGSGAQRSLRSEGMRRSAGDEVAILAKHLQEESKKSFRGADVCLITSAEQSFRYALKNPDNFRV